MYLYRFGIAIGTAWLCISAAAADPWETDNTPATAFLVTGTLRHSGRAISPAGDLDYYRFNVTGTATLVIETNRRPAEDDRMNITLLDAAEEIVANTSNSMAIDVTAGTYYAYIDNPDDEVIPAYDVSISYYVHAPDRFEPNDSILAAKTLAKGQVHSWLNLTPDTDEDWFVLNPGIQGDSIRTFIQATSPVRGLHFELYDQGGFDETPNPDNLNTLIVNMTPGNHKLRVTDYLDDGAVPSYTLAYWTAGGPDPYEDDDTPATASSIRPTGAGHTGHGHEQMRNVFPQGDEDWIRFYVSQSDNFQLTADTVFGTTPIVEVYDGTGTTLLAGPDVGFAFVGNPPDGFYMVRVYHDPNQTYDPQNAYEMQIVTIPIPRFSQGTLAGTVISADKASAVTGASISVLTPVQVATKSDASGVFIVDALPQGTYSVRASATGFVSQTKNANVGAGVTAVAFTLEADATNAADINGDNTVNAVDVQLIINAVLGLNVGNVDGDVNNDGNTNAVDIQLVINAALGL